MNSKILATACALGLAFSGASLAFADEGRSDLPVVHLRSEHVLPAPAMLGTVSAVSENSISITTKGGDSLIVDTSAAHITHIPNTTIALSDISVGDTVLVQGTLSGSTVTATRILDGIPHSSVQRGPDTEEGTSTADRGRDDVREHFLGEKTGLIMRIDHAISSFIGNHSRHGSDAQDGVAVEGAVTAINGASFSIEMPARGEHATSSALIETNASTTYEQGGQAANFSDLATSLIVRVRGIVTATSTMTIDARTVEIGTSTPNHGVSAEAHALMAGNGASSTVRIEFKNFIQTFIGRLGHLFHF